MLKNGSMKKWQREPARLYCISSRQPDKIHENIAMTPLVQDSCGAMQPLFRKP
jgi:hypothetical protein